MNSLSLLRGSLAAILALSILGAVTGPQRTAAQEAEPPSQPTPLSAEAMDELADLYFERLAAVFRAGSTAEDIESLFALMHPEVRYEHLRFGADFDLEAWRAAFQRNYERGAYQADPE